MTDEEKIEHLWTTKNIKNLKKKFNKLNSELRKENEKLNLAKNKEIEQICKKYNQLYKKIDDVINSRGYLKLNS